MSASFFGGDHKDVQKCLMAVIQLCEWTRRSLSCIHKWVNYNVKTTEEKITPKENSIK